MELNTTKVLVVGAGLAGTEAALYLAKQGATVYLAEVKTKKLGPAQETPFFAELVCTNSLKSLNPHSGHGLLKSEMEALGSQVLKAAKQTAVPAGDALAVDREEFAKLMTSYIEDHANINLIAQDVTDPEALRVELECDYAIVASGPLTTTGLESWIQGHLCPDDFYFYDAIAPVVDADSLDMSKFYLKDRHKPESESSDYLNCPLDKETYETFVQELVSAEKVKPAKFEEPKFFEACLPIDIMAERGKDTLSFGPMKPIGLEREGEKRPHAVIQLRKENLLGSAYNIVGFQNRLTYKEQKRVFKSLPGFADAEFIKLGSVHRNSFLNARKVLDFDMSCKSKPEIYFAGQITGVEGYTESASMGLYVAYQLCRKVRGEALAPWPVETAIGALVNYLMTSNRATPMNINFGLIPPVDLTREERKNRDRKKIKKEKAVVRAHEALKSYFGEQGYQC